MEILGTKRFILIGYNTDLAESVHCKARRGGVFIIISIIVIFLFFSLQSRETILILSPSDILAAGSEL